MNEQITILNKTETICTEHSFEFSFMTKEPRNVIYTDVAYVICKKCGQVRKSDVQ